MSVDTLPLTLHGKHRKDDSGAAAWDDSGALEMELIPAYVRFSHTHINQMSFPLVCGNLLLCEENRDRT